MIDHPGSGAPLSFAIRDGLRAVARAATPWTAVLLSAAFAGAAPSAGAPALQDATIHITLENDNEREEAAREQLERILAEFDVDRWIFTREVRIASMVTPHSHPVLTVNTKYLDDDPRQLSTFLHEQFHWWVIEDQRSDRLRAAIDEFAARYPDPPARENGGANSVRSSYLHLVVCDLEYQAMTALLGETAARELIATQDHYQWIYAKVLDDPAVRQINERHGLVVP
jgi:hypothetical protein